jgi:hypothetical protein
MDLLYVGIGVGFFILTWGLLWLCATLRKDESGEHL